jgi:hypothetical protein
MKQTSLLVEHTIETAIELLISCSLYEMVKTFFFAYLVLQFIFTEYRSVKLLTSAVKWFELASTYVHFAVLNKSLDYKLPNWAMDQNVFRILV